MAGDAGASAVLCSWHGATQAKRGQECVPQVKSHCEHVRLTVTILRYKQPYVFALQKELHPLAYNITPKKKR